MVLALALTLSLAQPPAAPEPAFRLDGAPLAEVSATYSPRGWLRVEGSGPDGGRHRFELDFPLLDPPAPGAHELRTGPLRARLDRVELAADERPAQLTVTACGPSRLELHVRWRPDADAEDERELTVACAPELAVERPQPWEAVPGTKGVVDRPRPTDLVFCAVANLGTDNPGTAALAEAMAARAASGPLDFVLLLGNVFAPRGVAAVDDPRWSTDFDDRFDRDRLDVPFYPLFGPAEEAGDVAALLTRGIRSGRFVADQVGLRVEQELAAGAGTVGVCGAHDALLTRSIADPRTRHALRFVTHPLELQQQKWKILCSHAAPAAAAVPRPEGRTQLLDERVGSQLSRLGVDVVLIGEGRYLRLVAPPAGGPLLVSCGGGGGDELGEPPPLVPGTRFAWAGGGFVWVRITGPSLILTFCDQDGAALYHHAVRKP